MRNYVMAALLPVLLLLALCGCGETQETQTAYYLYSVSLDDFSLQAERYTPASQEDEQLLAEYLALAADPENTFLPESVSLENFTLTDSVLTLDLSDEYAALETEEEILYRAACVRNFVQVSSVHYVHFLVGGEELTDSSGNVVGLMSADSFLEYSGKEINSYQYVKMTLYFADGEGRLVSEERDVYYNSNSVLEKAVVDQLIKGPKEEGHTATLSSSMKVVSVSVADGIAYVNLDEQLLADTVSSSMELRVYSIVNSLVAAGNVTRVQLSVNGDSSIDLGDGLTMETPFEVNPDLVAEE